MSIERYEERPHAVVHDLSVPNDRSRNAHGRTEGDVRAIMGVVLAGGVFERNKGACPGGLVAFPLFVDFGLG